MVKKSELIVISGVESKWLAEAWGNIGLMGLFYIFIGNVE